MENRKKRWNFFCRFNSPERKRICRDVEVQTSPSQMQDCIKEYIRRTWGKEAEELFGRKTMEDTCKNELNVSCLENICETKVNQKDITVGRNVFTNESDKESINVFTVNTDKCNDSDFVLGTEDPTFITNTASEIEKTKYYQPNVLKIISPHNGNEEMSVDRAYEFDPDAITQPNYRIIEGEKIKNDNCDVTKLISPQNGNDEMIVDPAFEFDPDAITQPNYRIIEAEKIKNDNCDVAKLISPQNGNEEMIVDRAYEFDPDTITQPNYKIIEEEKTKNDSSVVAKLISPQNVNEEMIVDHAYEVDPDAITQPNYKTPLVPKQMLKTSTVQMYSAISNPTDSELKRVDDIFRKNETIYPGITPVTTTLWNDSGIDRLESSAKVRENIDGETGKSIKSQKLKEKANKSRRQLDFMGNSRSDDNDMFHSYSPGNASDIQRTKRCIKKEHCKGIEEETHQSIPEGNQHKSEGERISNIDHILDNDVCKEISSEESDRASEDCFIEGTPDMSPTYLHQQRQEIVDENAVDFVNTCKVSICTPTNKRDRSPANSKVEVLQKSACRGFEQDQNVTSCNSNRSANVDFNGVLKEILENPENQRILPHSEQFNENRKINVKSGCAEQEENSELIENTEDIVNYCFASSLLSAGQTHLLMAVLKGLNIQYSKTVGAHISHLIVSTTNGCTKNTYKVLYAMALHKPIIRFEWVERVLKTGGTVPLDPFIALDPSGECGVLRARQDKKRELLQQFAIHVYNVIESVIKKEQIEELVRLCGGTVVSGLHNFQAVPRDIHRIIILSEPPETFTQGEWRQKYSAAEVSVDWLYNTIGQYKVVPLASYMVEQTNAVQFLLHEGYPETLIFDTSIHNDSATNV